MASTLDILPTALRLAEVELPKDRVFDGYDLSRALAGGKSRRREMFYYRGFELMAARLGPWKAHFQTQTGYGQPMAEMHNPPLLFNLDIDPSERFNVAAANPDALKEIQLLVEKHRAGMVPAPSQLE
jgi:arylsulfatase A-like enzyme